MASLSPARMESQPQPAEPGSLLRFITGIWHIRGSVPLPPEQTAEAALSRLDPLFAHSGTVHARVGDLVVVTKKDQQAQDPLSVVDRGTLQIVAEGEGSVLRYHLVSRALLYCFLAPLLFLAVGQLTVFLGMLEKPAAAAKADKKKEKEPALQLNPVDKWLGAPAPDKPKDDKKGADEGKDKFSPTSAYVFAGIFAAMWLLGRLLEPWLIRRLFQRTLAG